MHCNECTYAANDVQQQTAPFRRHRGGDGVTGVHGDRNVRRIACGLYTSLFHRLGRKKLEIYKQTTRNRKNKTSLALVISFLLPYVDEMDYRTTRWRPQFNFRGVHVPPTHPSPVGRASRRNAVRRSPGGHLPGRCQELALRVTRAEF